MGFGQIPGLDLLDGKEKIELKFEYRNGLIIVPVWYNNFLRLNFIFDTGAEHIILFNKTIHDLLDLGYDKRINLMGSDLREGVFAMISRNIKLKMQNGVSVKRDILVLEDDSIRIDEVLGYNIDGILGAGLFNNLIVQINYQKKKIKLYHPNYFDYKKLKDYDKIDISIINQKPYFESIITQENGDTLHQKILLDTGASLGLLLHHGGKQKIILPEMIIPGNIGIGIGGSLEGFIGKTTRMNFGKYRFDNILTHFQILDSVILANSNIIRNGLIGNHLLSRFDIFIDYIKEKLYIKARKGFDKPFIYDRSGIVLYAFGPKLNEFYVHRILANSPASEAGIQVGDIIKKIGWWSHKHYSLEKITRKLSGKVGKTIKLTLDRNGEKVKVKFLLRDLFAPKKQVKGP